MVAQHVTVSGRNMDIGEALKQHVETHMEALSEKYFGTLVTCRVAFTKMTKGHFYCCNIQVIVGRDMHYAAEAEFDDIHKCFTQALEHLAKQLRRQKRAKHEDKPNGHAKEWVLNELSQPDFEPEDGIPVYSTEGAHLSVDDVTPDAGKKAVEKLFGH